jgi:CheY-like chemotaxis protein
MLVLFLGSRGLKVTVAVDGATARRTIRDGLRALVLLDVGLPDMAGCGLLKQFRQSGPARYIPTIFLTRRSKKSDRLAGMQPRADDFITKPFNPDELYLRVQNAVSRAERENLSNPRTGLPAGQVPREEVAAARGQPERMVCEFHLSQPSMFHDQCGALAGSDLLRDTALVSNRVLNAAGSPDDLLGQLSEASLVVVTSAARADGIRKHIIERPSHDAVQLYALGECAGDKVRVTNAAGQKKVPPLIRLEGALAK